MDTIVDEFEQPVSDSSGETYRVALAGRSRPHDTWQGWLVFIRRRDGRRVETTVETTQPNREALRYWAAGLTDADFEGALERARAPRQEPEPRPAPLPIIGAGADAAGRERRRAEIERDILAVLAAAERNRLDIRELFDALPHSHADITRALEHLEKRDRLLARRTEQGTEWVVLTADGIRAGLIGGEQRV